jgi:hypothetical protein
VKGTRLPDGRAANLNRGRGGQQTFLVCQPKELGFCAVDHIGATEGPRRTVRTVFRKRLCCILEI